MSRDTQESDSNSRLDAARSCLKEIKQSFIRSDITLSLAEKLALEKASAQLDKVALQRVDLSSAHSKKITPEDLSFSERFLDAFTGSVYVSELDNLRQTDGAEMSEGDFSTLADSIRNFGLFLSEKDRKAFLESHM